MFYFDASYRPVPLETRFVGVSERNIAARNNLMDEVCYQKVADALRRGHQAMVFVHSRKDTGRTARAMAIKAQQAGEMALFDCTVEEGHALAARDVKKSRNREVGELFDSGMGIHHAGMLRGDRNLMERLFGSGFIKASRCRVVLIICPVNSFDFSGFCHKSPASCRALLLLLLLHLKE
jgi:activating signal cointegrator complex subunit 3